MKLVVEKEIFIAMPYLNIGAVVFAGIDNAADISGFMDSEYTSIMETVRAKFQGAELADYPVIRKWRDVYKGFGEKKARSSVEALIKRVKNGNSLYRINPLVDIYNLASLKFELPCGGEDIDSMDGDLALVFAGGDEEFIPLGGGGIENPNKGEIIYKTGNTVTCRNFNYRESEITKLTAGTKAAIIIFEDISEDKENLKPAMEWIKNKALGLLGAEVVAEAILDGDNLEFGW